MLALLAKPTAVVVPIILWVLDRWMLERSVKESKLALSAWVALAIPVIILTRITQQDTDISCITPL